MRVFSAAMHRIVLALAILSVPAQAATHYLVREWFQNGSQMCEYSNGTVLNVGGSTCPTSIQG